MPADNVKSLHIFLKAVNATSCAGSVSHCLQGGCQGAGLHCYGDKNKQTNKQTNKIKSNERQESERGVARKGFSVF